MGDKASIFLKYDVTLCDKSYSGLMVNLYHGFNPRGMIRRIPHALACFLDNIFEVRNITEKPVWKSNLYQTIRRMFDVDFQRKSLHVSEDGLEMMQEFLDNGWCKPEDVNSDLFFYDEDYGQLYIYVSGNHVDGVKASYVYYYCDEYLDVKGYLNHFKNRILYRELFELNNDAERLSGMASLLKKEQMKKLFFSDDYYSMY